MNRRVHKTINMTPYEAWYNEKPDLSTLKVFGSRVSVEVTSKRQSKLDWHDFTGIFIGYTTTDENIRYIDVDTSIVKTSHHTVFDESWYLQPSWPPMAQLLYVQRGYGKWGWILIATTQSTKRTCPLATSSWKATTTATEICNWDTLTIATHWSSYPLDGGSGSSKSGRSIL